MDIYKIKNHLKKIIYFYYIQYMYIINKLRNK